MFESLEVIYHNIIIFENPKQTPKVSRARAHTRCLGEYLITTVQLVHRSYQLKRIANYLIFQVDFNQMYTQCYTVTQDVCALVLFDFTVHLPFSSFG